MSATEDAARERLRDLRPDVLRIAAGLAAAVSFENDPATTDEWLPFAEVVATGALAIVQAVDRVTGGDA